MRSYTNSHSPRPVLIALSLLFAMLFGMEGSGMTFGKIGSRKMMYEWKNPYVTNGLIAMWDVEHGFNGSTIRDLVGGYDITVYGQPDHHGQYLDLKGATRLESTVVPFANVLNRTDMTGWTVEIVASVNSVVNDASVVKYDVTSGNHRSLWGRHGAGYYLQTIEYRRDSYAIINAGNSATNCVSIIADSTNGVLINAVSVLTNGADSRWNSMGNIVAEDSPFTFGDGCDDNWYCARVYNRTLAPNERSSNYANDKARFNLP